MVMPTRESLLFSHMKLFLSILNRRSSDFLSNLLVLLLKLRNAQVDDNGLLMHLSEATAGSLSGVGHSAAYEDPGTYRCVLPVASSFYVV